MEYEKLLKKARKEMPEVVFKKERFEIPKVKGHIQGNRTVVINFNQIAATLRIKPEHLLKYVLKELATPGDMKKKAVLLGTKVPASRINDKIRQYANEFVLCRECGKPDTQLTKDGKMTNLRCAACGARYVVKARI